MNVKRWRQLRRRRDDVAFGAAGVGDDGWLPDAVVQFRQ
jgi:hypothetical protein